MTAGEAGLVAPPGGVNGSQEAEGKQLAAEEWGLYQVQSQALTCRNQGLESTGKGAWVLATLVSLFRFCFPGQVGS